MYDPIQQIWSSLPPSLRKRSSVPAAATLAESAPPRAGKESIPKSAPLPAPPMANLASQTPSEKNHLTKARRKSVATVAQKSSVRLASVDAITSGGAVDVIEPLGHCERTLRMAHRNGKRTALSAQHRTEERALVSVVDSGQNFEVYTATFTHLHPYDTPHVNHRCVRGSVRCPRPSSISSPWHCPLSRGNTPALCTPPRPIRIWPSLRRCGRRLLGCCPSQCSAGRAQIEAVSSTGQHNNVASPSSVAASLHSYHIAVAESAAMAATVCSHGVVRTWDLESGECLSEPLRDAMCAKRIPAV
jgi:hypothetical protein